MIVSLGYAYYSDVSEFEVDHVFLYSIIKSNPESNVVNLSVRHVVKPTA